MFGALRHRSRLFMRGPTERLRVPRNRHADPDINTNFNLNTASIAAGDAITDEHANRDGATPIRCRSRFSGRWERYL
jgi:hypothetical protein